MNDDIEKRAEEYADKTGRDVYCGYDTTGRYEGYLAGARAERERLNEIRMEQTQMLRNEASELRAALEEYAKLHGAWHHIADIGARARKALGKGE